MREITIKASRELDPNEAGKLMLSLLYASQAWAGDVEGYVEFTASFPELAEEQEWQDAQEFNHMMEDLERNEQLVEWSWV